MKIICENLEEYDELMKVCKYLHDFSVSKKDFKYLERDICAIGLDLENYPLLNTIVGLYLSKKDYPDKFDIVSIK